MINKIGLQNFRVFKEEQSFDFKQINILTGANNCGKSAIQKFLFLLKSSFSEGGKSSTFEKLVFNTETIQKIDLYENNLTYKSDDDKMIFTLGYSDQLWGDVDICLCYQKSNSSEDALLRFIEIIKESKVIFRFENKRCFPTDPKIKEQDAVEFYESFFGKKPETIKEAMRFYNSGGSNDDSKWFYINTELTYDILDVYYSLFLQDKKQYLTYKSISELSQKKTLSKEDEDLKKDLEEKGYLFNDDRAWEEIQSNKQQFIERQLPVWDMKKKRACRISDAKTTFNSFYYDENPEVFIPTLLSYVVFGTPNFFKGKIIEKKASKIRELLYLQEIDSKEEFLSEYKKFELGIIKQSLLSSDYEIRNYVGEKNTTPEPKQEHDFLKYFHPNSLLIDGVVLNGSEKILNILKSDEFNDLNFEAENVYYDSLKGKLDNDEFNLFYPLERKIPVNADNDIKNIKNIEASIRNLPRKLVGQLNTQLKELMLNCSIAFESTSIKKYYFYNEAEPQDKLFLDFANSYDSQKINDQYKFCNHWLKEFDIADELIVEQVMVANKPLGLSFWIFKDGENYPIGDSGVGVNQVIQLLIRIAAQSKKSLLLIEEPESNLHPAYQSKMAELVADAVQHFQLKFIIETHSEYFIRKFQYLVAHPDYKVKADDISISYLYHPDKVPQSKNQVEKLEIRPDGILKQDFGVGFFDENARLTMDLLKLQNHN
ncbi:AAA family ATPase [Carboxylicivirga sp. N1Y90]|uniref:AAA family ATPase n=1 Tax=Carboxylicivirga fragile TaxID=3417571 RepID=UPI003D341707|nr:AAA family ATPase [Marinilabiliaceae bacterium N1Y90]